MTARLVLLGLALMLRPALADDLAPPVPVAPQRLDIVDTGAPMVTPAQAVSPPGAKRANAATPPRPPAASTRATGISRTVEVAPSVRRVSGSTRFLLEDVTHRDPQGAAVPGEQRRAAVETLRHRLLRAGKD